MRTPETLPPLATLAAQLRGTNLRAHTQSEIADLLDHLLARYETIRVGFGSADPWLRARLCPGPGGFQSLRDMLYPPTPSSTFGRANLPGERTLYASMNRRTALDEIGASAGEYVQMIGLRIKEKQTVPFVVVGEIESILNTGRSITRNSSTEESVNGRQASDSVRINELLFLDSFLAEAFRKQAPRPHDYMLTATFASKAREKFGGLIYGSVRMVGGLNVAVDAETFDRSFEVVFTDVCRVNRYFGHSVYDLTFVKGTTAFLEDGSIAWGDGPQNKYRPPVD